MNVSDAPYGAKDVPEFKRIYLSPTCADCDRVNERMWCKDAQDPCEECGRKWVPFDLSDPSRLSGATTESARVGEGE